MAKARPYQLNKTKYLQDPELEQLEHVLDRFADQFERDCLLIRVALHTGARAQEVLNILKSDLNVYDRSVLIRGLKGSSDREIPLPSKLFDRLNRFAQTQTGLHVFAISYPRFSQIWDQYRPVKKKLHSLRHTFAIRLYKKTKDIRLVQVALGHRNIANTMVYADYVYSQSELRRLIL